jgi:hypothetical protein
MLPTLKLFIVRTSGENLSPIPIYVGNGTEIFKDGTEWD